MESILLDLIAVILIAMFISAFVGDGKFYNKCIKQIDTFVHCDTIETTK